MRKLFLFPLMATTIFMMGQEGGCDQQDADGDGWTVPDGDCDDADADIHPGADEVCDGVDNDCDGQTDDVDADGDGSIAEECGGEDCDDNDASITSCNLSFGGHRIDKDGEYYYVLYNDDGFGILGTSEWYGSSDASSTPEGCTWNEDQTRLYYNDLRGQVFSQEEPFDATSDYHGTFDVGQVGGGVFYNGTYYVGDYNNGNIYAMDVATGTTWLYSELGSDACKPYFGNSAMSIDDDGRVFAASSCGIVVYNEDGIAEQLNDYTNLETMVAMDADQELYSMDYSGYIVHFDKETGETLSKVLTDYPPSTTWTMAIDENYFAIVNYWGEQRIFDLTDGSLVQEYSASSYYPGSSGYYWYVTW